MTTFNLIFARLAVLRLDLRRLEYGGINVGSYCNHHLLFIYLFNVQTLTSWTTRRCLMSLSSWRGNRFMHTKFCCSQLHPGEEVSCHWFTFQCCLFLGLFIGIQPEIYCIWSVKKLGGKSNKTPSIDWSNTCCWNLLIYTVKSALNHFNPSIMPKS